MVGSVCCVAKWNKIARRGVAKRRKCPWERRTQYQWLMLIFRRWGKRQAPPPQPAALLAESLSQPGGDDGGGFGVELAHLVAAVVVLGLRQISIASLGLAARGVGGSRRTGFRRPGPTVETAHEIVLGGGEIRPATEIQANSWADKVHGPAHVLGLGNEEESARAGAGPRAAVGGVDVGQRVKREHGRGWGVGGGGRAVEGAWVEERVVVVVVVDLVVVRLRVEVVVVVGELDGGGRGGGDGGVSWRVQKVVGDERVRRVVVEDLTVRLVGSPGGGLLVSG